MAPGRTFAVHYYAIYPHPVRSNDWVGVPPILVRRGPASDTLVRLAGPRRGGAADSEQVATPKLRVVYERVLEKRQAIEVERGLLKPFAQGACPYAFAAADRTLREAQVAVPLLHEAYISMPSEEKQGYNAGAPHWLPGVITQTYHEGQVRPVGIMRHD